MKNLRVVTRVLVIDKGRILLARTKGKKYWYPPGGGWEYESETIKECASREIAEETGYKVDIGNLLWVQEFHAGEKIGFEVFWHATLSADNTQTEARMLAHVDTDIEGNMEESRWFTTKDLEQLTVYPQRVKDFIDIPRQQLSKIDPFIGVMS